MCSRFRAALTVIAVDKWWTARWWTCAATQLSSYRAKCWAGPTTITFRPSLQEENTWLCKRPNWGRSLILMDCSTCWLSVTSVRLDLWVWHKIELRGRACALARRSGENVIRLWAVKVCPSGQTAYCIPSNPERHCTFTLRYDMSILMGVASDELVTRLSLYLNSSYTPMLMHWCPLLPSSEH